MKKIVVDQINFNTVNAMCGFCLESGVRCFRSPYPVKYDYWIMKESYETKVEVDICYDCVKQLAKLPA